jgi:hypothetical protein
MKGSTLIGKTKGNAIQSRGSVTSLSHNSNSSTKRRRNRKNSSSIIISMTAIINKHSKMSFPKTKIVK